MSTRSRDAVADGDTWITLEEVREAARALPPQLLRTPLLPSPALSEAVGAPVWFKAENLQATGSYKPRAAFTLLSRLSPEERARGAAISSSGNFAAAWAWAGRLLGIPTAVVMPQSVSPLKLERTRRLGAEVVLCADSFDARWETLARLETRGLRTIDTFEHPDVLRGHGTVGLEIVEALPEVETLLVPVSSGGLIAGIAVAVKALRPSARVLGVQPEGSRAAVESFRRGEVTRCEVRTICDALIAAAPGRLPLRHILRHVDDMLVVPEAAVREAVRWLAEEAKLVVEAGGAVGVAALLAGLVRPTGPTVALLSGGNIHPATLAAYLAPDSAPPR